MSELLSAVPALVSVGISVFNYYHVLQLAEVIVDKTVVINDQENFRDKIETVQWASLAAAITTSIDGVCRITQAIKSHPHHYHYHPEHMHPPPYMEHDDIGNGRFH